jgi:hypothetical protein
MYSHPLPPRRHKRIGWRRFLALLIGLSLAGAAPAQGTPRRSCPPASSHPSRLSAKHGARLHCRRARKARHVTDHLAYARFSPIGTAAGGNVLGNPAVLLHTEKIAPAQHSEQFTTRLTLTPTTSETWALTSISMRLYAGYRLGYELHNAAGYKALKQQEVQIGGVEGQIDQLRKAIAIAGKTLLENTMLAGEIAAAEGALRVIQRELATFEVSTAAERAIEPALTLLATITTPSGDTIWQMHTDPRRMVLQRFAPEVEEAHTTVTLQLLDFYEIYEPLPVPIPISNGENLTLTIQPIGPELLEGLEGPVLTAPRLAMPYAELGYSQEPRQ